MNVWKYNESLPERKMTLVTADTLTVYPEVLGLCVGVKMDSRLGATLTNQSLVQ